MDGVFYDSVSHAHRVSVVGFIGVCGNHYGVHCGVWSCEL